MVPRCLSKPWGADAYMTEVLERIIRDGGSMVSAIEHSPDLSGVFKGFCENMTDNPVKANGIKNLKMRKHRYDSLQRPLSRLCLWLDAFLMTAVWTMINRPRTAPAANAEACPGKGRPAQHRFAS